MDEIYLEKLSSFNAESGGDQKLEKFLSQKISGGHFT